MPAQQIDALLRHESYVRALARRLVFDEDLARDVEQETWLAALQNAPRESSTSPRAWLAQIVRNFAIKAFRSRSRRAERELAWQPPGDLPTDPALLLEREDSRRTLVQAVAALDEPWRSTLILHFFDELSPAQIARREHVPVKTVYERIQRGLELLRGRLERTDGRDRRACAVALVHTLRLEPPSSGAIARAALKTMLKGALIMGAVQKVTIGAAAVVALAGALWVWSAGHSAEPSAISPAPSASEQLALEPAMSANVAATAPRTEADAAPSEPRLGAETAEEASKLGSLTLLVRWDDDTPAAGVWMRLHQANADDRYFSGVREVCSGIGGSVQVERLVPGTIDVRFDRGVRSVVKVDPGVHSQETLYIRRGIDCTGTVIDVDGRPFAGADIYLQTWGESYEGFVVGHSALDGTFGIRSVKPRTMACISARAKGRAPTKQALVIGVDNAGAVVRLQFERTGGELTGRVSDARGQPIVDASVVVGGDDDETQIHLPDGALGREPASQRERSNAQGEFRFAGVGAGRQHVRVRADGFAPWSGEVEVFERAANTVDVQLTHGATLRGTARDAAGKPVGGVEIWANPSSSFTASTRTTKSDGTFTIGDLAAGACEVTAAHDVLGQAQTEVFAVEGGELRWDPVLTHGLVLRGHVAASGRELSGWTVIVQALPTTVESWADRTETDELGRFEIANCASGTLRVRLYPPGVSEFPAAIVEGVQASDGELELTPSPALEPSVHLRGRIIDADGRPVPGGAFCPCTAALPSQPLLAADATTGRFDVGPYPPGDWCIRAISTSGAGSTSAKHTLVAGETWDFGDIQIVRGAVVVVKLDCRCGSVATPIRAQLRDETGWMESLTIEEGEGHSGRLAPGHYVLTVEREGCAKLERDVEVRSEDLHFAVELHAP